MISARARWLGIGALCAVAWLAGCSTVQRYTWNCANGACEPTKFRADDAECQAEANKPYVPLVAGQGPRLTIYKDCMEGRGYVKLGSESVPEPTRWHTMPEPIKRQSLPTVTSWAGATVVVTEGRQPPRSVVKRGSDAPNWDRYSAAVVHYARVALVDAIGPTALGSDFELRVRVLEHAAAFRSPNWVGTAALEATLIRAGQPTSRRWAGRGEASQWNWLGMSTARSVAQSAYEAAVGDLLRQLAGTPLSSVQDEPPSATAATRPPSRATEQLAEAVPNSGPPESKSQVSAAPPIVAAATPQALGSPPTSDRPITIAWLTDARWEGTYRGYHISLRISADGPQELTWFMVARRGSQTVIGQPGNVTVSGSHATLQGQDANGARVTFLLTRTAEMLKGEALVGDDPPEAVSLKGIR